jgi:hypothetical protein
MKIIKHHTIIRSLTLIAIVVMAFFYWPAPAHAAATQLYLSPANQSFTNGSNLVVSVVVNTGGASINTIQTVFTYTAADYNFVSITSGASFGTFTYTQLSGSIQFTAATTGSVSGVQTAAAITLKAISLSNTTMGLAGVCPAGNYALTCSAAYDSMTSDNDLSSVAGGSYTVVAPTPVSKPVTTSTTQHSTTTSTPTTTVSTPTTVAPTLSITAVKVSDVTAVSATITWQTNLAANSTVEYGLTDSYGLTAKDSALTTNHSVTINSPLLAPDSTYYLQVVSVAADGSSVIGGAQQFTTAHLAVAVTVVGSNNQPVEGAEVIIDGQSQTTNTKGIASFSDVPIGSQKVFIVSGGKVTDHTVSIGQLNTKGGGYDLQKFKFTANKSKSNNTAVYIILIVFILLIAVIMLIPRNILLKKHILQKGSKVIVARINPAFKAFIKPKLNTARATAPPLSETTVSDATKPVQPK